MTVDKQASSVDVGYLILQNWHLAALIPFINHEIHCKGTSSALSIHEDFLRSRQSRPYKYRAELAP